MSDAKIPTAVAKLISPAKATPVFITYWRFAAERMEILIRRARGLPAPWTADPILLKYRFTNAYRAADRVSQYLIREVAYAGPQSNADLLLRILLFKLFNKIETWHLLQERLGDLSVNNFDRPRIDRILTRAIEAGTRVYSAAYIMPSGPKKMRRSRKHRYHLALLQMMLDDRLADRLAECRRMQDGFTLLRAYPGIGDFLAYQFVTDLNYSTLTGFTETEFVVPGPGARSGLRKCFSNLGGLTEVEMIRLVCDRQSEFLNALGLEMKPLWGRPLQLIDCQNLFCEVDKYARVAHPDVLGTTNRMKIKQNFSPDNSPIRYWFPPKWGINAAAMPEASPVGGHLC